MCGIVGLFAKSHEIEARLGRALRRDARADVEPRPDSAGVAVYRDLPSGASKLTLYSADPAERWAPSAMAWERPFGGCVYLVRASHAVLAV